MSENYFKNERNLTWSQQEVRNTGNSQLKNLFTKSQYESLDAMYSVFIKLMLKYKKNQSL